MSELYREDNARGTDGNINMERGEISHPAGSDPEDPTKVLPMGRLLSNVRALEKLTAPREPPRVRLRAWNILQALYLPGNASGAGFGSTAIGTNVIMYESWTWNEDWSNESSNFREADNLVIKIEPLVKDGVFFYTKKTCIFCRKSTTSHYDDTNRYK